jgi:hypothetical protein
MSLQSNVSSVRRISSSGDLSTLLIFGVSEISLSIGAWLTLKAAPVRLTSNETDGLSGSVGDFKSRHDKLVTKFL